MLIAWALFPLVLLVVCLGCGLLVQRLAGWRAPGTLIPSFGLALVIVAATLVTRSGATARFATAIVVALTLAGYATSWVRVRQLRPEPWALALGLALYAVLAAPVVLSGNATFLGYFVLNDTAIHFTLIDQLLSHGRDLAGIHPSATLSLLQSYISSNYPIGAQVALGAVRPLVGQDVAWIFQPYLAAILVLGALALYELLAGVVRPRALRALCAFVASQAGLVYAYYLEASVKELATTWTISLTVVTVLVTLARPLGLRRLVPLALVVVAGFDVLNLAIAPWLGIPLACFVAVVAWRGRSQVGAWRRRSAAGTKPGRRLALGAVGFAIAVAAMAAPVIAGARSFFKVADSVLTQQGDLGNLVAPLVKWQMLGIWPSGDFRFPVVGHYRIAYALLGIASASVAFGVLWALRRRAAAPLLLLASSGIAALYLLSRASPYASAKVMMIFSMAVVLTAMLGAVGLHDAGRRLEGWGLALVLAGGVLWTNAMAYRGASVAPRERLAELAAIGQRFAGQGPSFYNLSDEFAAHFLRAEAPSDSAFGPPPARPGAPARDYMNVRAPWDPDELDQAYVQSFRLLVLGRSPRLSRPPADFQLAYRGSYYEVWRRRATPRVLEHVPLGAGLDPAGVPACRTVIALARRARQGGARLAYVSRPPMASLVPTSARRPDNWGEVGGDPYSLIPRREAGEVLGTVAVASAGRYRAWLQGTFSRPVQVWVDGRQVGSYSYELGAPGQTVPAGTLELAAGSHRVRIAVPSDGLAPGVSLANQTIGPLMLAPAVESLPVATVDPARARGLCGRRLDWIELVR